MTRTLMGLCASLLFAAILMLAPAPTLHADQPHMQAALDALKTAEKQLEQASEDKGGHRAKALKHLRATIRETEAGIRFDRKH